MSWFKKIASPKIRRQFNTPSDSPVPMFNKQKILWNAIRKSGISATLYHGTSVGFFENMKQKGGLITPTNLGTVDYEKRKVNLDKVFLTSSVSYAQFYSKRAKEQSRSTGIILLFNVPLYYLEDIKGAVFGDMPYNEMHEHNDNIRRIILDNNYGFKCIEQIKNYVESIGGKNEFLCWMILPLRFLKDKWIDGDASPQFIKQWEREIEKDPRSITDVPENIRGLLSKESIINSRKKYYEENMEEIEHAEQYNLPEDFILKIWMKYINRYPVIEKRIPQKIKSALPIGFLEKAWMHYLAKRPEDIVKITEQTKLSIPPNFWEEYLKENPFQFEKIPDQVKPGLRHIYRDAWINHLSQNPIELKWAPDDVKPYITQDFLIDAYVRHFQNYPYSLAAAGNAMPKNIIPIVEQKLNRKLRI